MREPEGIATPPPGNSSERAWSKHREPDIRNVEAVGSNPITSTIHLVGPRRKPGILSFPAISAHSAGLTTGLFDVLIDA